MSATGSVLTHAQCNMTIVTLTVSHKPADKLLPSAQKEALNIPTDYHTVVDPVFN